MENKKTIETFGSVESFVCPKCGHSLGIELYTYGTTMYTVEDNEDGDGIEVGDVIGSYSEISMYRCALCHEPVSAQQDFDCKFCGVTHKQGTMLLDLECLYNYLKAIAVKRFE